MQNAIIRSRAYLGADCDSDHAPVIAEVHAKMKKPERGQPHLKYDYNNIDVENLKQILAKTEVLMAEIKDESPEEIMWEIWKTSSCKMRDNYIPVMKKSKNAWISNEILELM